MKSCGMIIATAITPLVVGRYLVTWKWSRSTAFRVSRVRWLFYCHSVCTILLDVDEKHEERLLYRERIFPRPTTFALEIMFVAMVAIAYGAALDPSIGSLIFVIGGATLVGISWLRSPIVEIRQLGASSSIRAGGATAPSTAFAHPKILQPAEVQAIRRGTMQTTAFNGLRSNLPAVVIDVIDPEDPHQSWVLSTRKPEKIIEALGALDIK